MDKVVCLGKNYPAHAAELGDTQPAKPVIFLKPPSVVRYSEAGRDLVASLPLDRGSVHHECEIVLRISRGGYALSIKESENLISHVALGLDMTLREEQTRLKKEGHPWTVAKVFPDSCLVGPWRRVKDFPDFLEEPFSLTINGTVRQKAMGQHMLMKPVECLSYVSHFFPLCDGDLIFTGTPVGVQAVVRGDQAVLEWAGSHSTITWNSDDRLQVSRDTEKHPS